MVTKARNLQLSEDAEISVSLSRAERIVGAVTVTVLAVLSSVATAAVVYGRMATRMEQVEQQQAQYKTDHDVLTRVDERTKFIYEQLGGKKE